MLIGAVTVDAHPAALLSLACLRASGAHRSHVLPVNLRVGIHGRRYTSTLNDASTASELSISSLSLMLAAVSDVERCHARRELPRDGVRGVSTRKLQPRCFLLLERSMQRVAREFY